MANAFKVSRTFGSISLWNVPLSYAGMEVEEAIIEGLPAKRAYIAFFADFHFLQDQANFWQTDLF